MATDIWTGTQGTSQPLDKAFSDATCGQEKSEDDADRKATIVIEHLIQASDVSYYAALAHLSQMERPSFEELYRAFVDGRSDNDPSEFCTRARLVFLTFHPLAKKLKDCGVFGVSRMST
jgi:hypothetical protein